jgi:hypothetical protein
MQQPAPTGDGVLRKLRVISDLHFTKFSASSRSEISTILLNHLSHNAEFNTFSLSKQLLSIRGANPQLRAGLL